MCIPKTDRSTSRLHALLLAVWCLSGGCVTGWILAACSAAPAVLHDQTDSMRGPAVTHAPPSDTLHLEPVSHTAFDDARAMAVDPLGFIYVADAGRHVVLKLNATGALEAVIGGPGSREGEFDEPSGVEATNGLVLFVADANNRRIQRFSRSNAYLGSIPLMHAGQANPDSRVTYRRGDGDVEGFSTGRPTAVVSSGSKEVYAIDADRNVVLKWDEDLRLAAVIGDVGAGRGTLAEPVDLALGPRSLVYIADRRRAAIVVFDQFGSYVRAFGDGRLADLRSVSVAEEAVFAGHARHVSLYTLNGTFFGTLALAMDEALVDLIVTRESLFVLTPRRLFRAPAPVLAEP